MEAHVRELMAIVLVLLGLSHIVWSATWARFFTGLRAMGLASVDNSCKFALVGVPMVIVGLLLM